jgi:hypothetical protein
VLIGRVGDRGACSSATILDSESYVLVRHEVERALGRRFDPHRWMRPPLFLDYLARAAEFGWEVFQFRQAVPHGQHRLSVVDVNAGGEGKGRDRRGEYVHETQGRVIGHQVPAALRAILALAEFGLLERRDMLGARCDAHGLWLPEAEGVHRSAGP